MMFRLIRENVERLVESEREKQALIKEGYREISVTGANPELTKEEKGEEANPELTKEEEGKETNPKQPKKKEAKQEPKKKAAEA